MNYQVCVRTVMDTSDPEIWFDEQGVCSHALRYDAEFAQTVDAAMRGEREGELQQLVQTIKQAGRGKAYDCIIGVSGGVDSSYLALQAVNHGLRPLAVHFDSGWNSELAVGNIENLVSRLGIDFYSEVVDWREMRDLQLSFFKASVANCDIPTDHAFGHVAFQQAVKHDVKFILSGHNLATESILPSAWGYNAGDSKHVKAIQKRFGTVPLKAYPTVGLAKRYLWYEGIRGIKTVRPLNYMRYVHKEAKEAIAKELGWRDYGGKHYESVFTRYFQGYYLPTKFGFDKRRAHLSSLILSNQMTRDEAIEELKHSNYDEKLWKQDHDFIAKKLGLSTSEFEEILNRPKVDHMEYPNQKWLWDLLLKIKRRSQSRPSEAS